MVCFFVKWVAHFHGRCYNDSKREHLSHTRLVFVGVGVLLNPQGGFSVPVKSKVNASFDYLKFVLAILVVSLHTRFLTGALYPLQRLAVPLFFIMSSYFFFGKLRATPDAAQQKAQLKGFCKRNWQLYAFWTVVLLPVVVYTRRGWFSLSVVRCILTILRDVFYAGAFTASWFLIALIIATALIFWGAQKLSNLWLLGLSFLVYVGALFFSGFSFLIPEGSALSAGMAWYAEVFVSPCNSFPVALLWVTMGKCFADGTFDGLAKVAEKGTRWVCGAAVLILLYGEWLFVRHMTDGSGKDCYLMLVLAAPVLFQIVKGISLEANGVSRFLRQSSIVLFVLHGSVLHVLRPILRMIGLEYNGLLFVLISLGCLAATWIILRLENKKGFRWLKYAH